jgi:hypothetical protein
VLPLVSSGIATPFPGAEPQKLFGKSHTFYQRVDRSVNETGSRMVVIFITSRGSVSDSAGPISPALCPPP